MTFPISASTPNYPVPKEGDWVVRDFQFHTGEVMPELRLHYRTIGSPSGEPVLILHGTGGDGTRFLADSFSGVLFGQGQPIDATRYSIILPDAVGHGKSSKPSDGLKARFPKYNYADMVRAQYRLVTEHLGVRHVRLIIGGSMGGMHAWLWGEMYPDFMDALMPLQCLPVEIAGINRMLRRIVLDSIRNDPEWRDGNYEKQPVHGLTVAQYGTLAMFGSPLQLYDASPTRAMADAAFDKRIKDGVAVVDANDMLYQFHASSDYNPAPDLEKIVARVVAINTEDDSVNPPELGIMDREIRRVKNGCYVLVRRSTETTGHGSYSTGSVYVKYLRDLLNVR